MDADALRRLVNDAGFIFRGRVAAEPKADLPAFPAGAGEAVAVQIEEVLRGTEVTRGLVGAKAIVLARNAQELRDACDVILFTSVLSLGKEVHLRELGHTRISGETSRDVAEALREAEERPLRERIETAELIVTGEVVESREVERPFPPRSEHDPEWWIARVAVGDVLKGRKPRGEVDVLFANSRDIAWYKSPKLHPGASGVFLLHRIDAEEAPKEAVPRSGLKATDPLDFLPADRRDDVERLIGGTKGER